MANTFFGFDTTINNDSTILPDDDADLGEGEEDEYDALNDETFGTLGDSSALNDDWEEQHQQYAHYDENSKQTERLENSIRDFVLNDSDDDDVLLPQSRKTDWSYKPESQSAPVQKEVPSQSQHKNGDNEQWWLNIEMPTVEEIEEMVKLFAYLPPRKSPRKQQNVGIKQQPPPHLQHPQVPPIQPQRMPPGFFPPPPTQQMPQSPQQRPPPGLGPRMPPGFPSCMPHTGMPSNMRPPPGGFPMPPPMMRPVMPLPPGVPQYGYPNFPMPPTIRNGPPMSSMPPHLQQQLKMRQERFPNFPMQPQQHKLPPPPQQQQNLNQQQQQQNNRNQNHQRGASGQQHQGPGATQSQVKDEYDGLMTNREKQWLLNIQQLQLNTGTPYFDDYYYTIFKERKARSDKENTAFIPRHGNHHHHHQQQRNRNHQNDNNQLTARIYTPLQFENSLGKLQCVSVTAPRKIIDTDVVTLEKDSENTPTRDTRKTKQLLLELESLYSLVLKAEDLLNPIAISNMEKLLELKQKQRLREMEAAATAEQKQELLKLLQAESTPQKENPSEYLLKTMAGLLQDDKFASFMNIRKGKMLLLRLLPLLGLDYNLDEYALLWCKVLLCIPLIGRRDSAGDNLLPRLHPYFKRFVQSTRMSDIIAIVNKLEQCMRFNTDSRCTPLSHQSKAPLQFVVGNKFGVSALVTIFVRTEYLISSGNAQEEQIDDWAAFLSNWAEATNCRSVMATPLELIPRPVFLKHVNRFTRLSEDKKALLERHYVDIYN